jgi:cytochrome c553
MKKALTLLAILGTLAAGAFTAAHAQTAAPAPAASPQAGAKLVAMCMGCHNIIGYQASFPEVYKVPKIAGQNAAYIVSALQAYKKGERKHPTMRGIAGSLSDQDMADVAAFYEQLGKKDGADTPPSNLAVQPTGEVEALLKKGNCVSCHGGNLSTPIAPNYPKLAGQYADYLFDALKAYQSDNNPHFGRANPIMGAQAKPFSHAELKELAEYISSLPGEVKTVPESRFR